MAAASGGVPSVDHDHVLTHAAVVVGETDGRLRHLPRAGLSTELQEDLRGLSHAGGAQWMPAADEPAARVHDHVAAVVATPRRHEGARLALAAKPQLLVGDQLGD